MSDAAHAQRKRLTGNVAWFALEKGYGFIAIDGLSRDLFFHVRDWVHEADPRKGDRVSFIEDTDRAGRPCACQVVVVE
jgi:cold shock CspA family protein